MKAVSLCSSVSLCLRGDHAPWTTEAQRHRANTEKNPRVLKRVILGITRNRRGVQRSDKFLRQHFNFLISELRLVEICVQPTTPDQLFVIALLNNRAVVNDKDHICPLDRRQTMSDYD